MPGGVKALLDDWLQAASLTAGKLFRRVNKNGKAWGEGLTEKAVCHVIREYTAKLELRSWHLTIFGEPVLGCVTRRAASWSRSSSCLDTSLSRRPSGTSAANSAYDLP